MKFEVMAALAIKHAYGKIGMDPSAVITSRGEWKWITSTEGTQVCCFIWERCFVAAFRGSNGWDNLDGLKDWYNDLDCKMVPFPLEDKATVHRGFLRGFDSIKDKLWCLWNEWRSRNLVDRFAPMGHSLGGAEAQLAGTYWHKSNFCVWQVTEGAPRVGNDRYRDISRGKELSIRFVVPGDPVTEVPRKEPPFWVPWARFYWHEDGKTLLKDGKAIPVVYSDKERTLKGWWHRWSWPMSGNVDWSKIKKLCPLHEPDLYKNSILTAYS